MSPTLLSTLLACAFSVLSISVAANAWFVKAALAELRELRIGQQQHAVALARHDGRIISLERQLPCLSPSHVPAGR